jgi:1-acyl-sn-glycerol-3-phosphate acyltransferase
MVGQIPTEREGGKKSEHALNAALEVLRDGKLLGIYPEGTRSPDGRLYRGRTGVARLALTAGVPVIPTGLIGTPEVMPIDKKMPRMTGRFPVRVRFGQPLDFSRFAGRERDRFALRSITDEIQYEIMQLSGQQYVDEYASRTPSEPLPESTRYVDDIDLSDEALVG